MKIRTDIVRLYKDVHGWVGIFCGLFLFTAFFAGAVTMFQGPLERWLSPAVMVPSTPIADVPRLIQQTLKTHPEAKRGYSITIDENAPDQARMVWVKRDKDAARDHDETKGTRFSAGFGPDGKLNVAVTPVTPVGHFINLLHQQAGIPLGHETAMIIVGIICLLYAIALVSGVVILLPSLVKDLFAMRLGKNIKRKWLDIHNALGIFSLPFHIIMALTTLVFAFHDVFYDVQDTVVHGGKIQQLWSRPNVPKPARGTPLQPASEIIAGMQETYPDFTVTRLEYSAGKGGALLLRVWGTDPQHGVRARSEGFAVLNPYSGAVIQNDYMPGAQNGWYATLTAFFTLHFGSYGGLPVRWGYFALGLVGAFLFYSGNVLWVETRRRRNGGVDTGSTRNLERLTIGWVAGTVAGTALLIAVGKAAAMAGVRLNPWMAFYVIFIAAILWAFLRPALAAKRELFWFSGLTSAATGACLLIVQFV